GPLVSQHTQVARRDLLPWLLIVAAREEVRRRRLARDFGETGDVVVGRSLGPDLSRHLVVVLIEILHPLRLVQVGTAVIDVQARMVLEDLLLLRRALGGRGAAGRTGQL